MFILGDGKQGKILSRDEPLHQQALLDEIKKTLPVATPVVHQYQRFGGRLAGLDQGKDLHGLVQCAEAARKDRHGIGLLDKGHLAVEEIFVGNQSWIAVHDRIGFLFKRQTYVYGKRVLAAGAIVAGLHDAWAATGDDHVPLVCQHTAEVDTF